MAKEEKISDEQQDKDESENNAPQGRERKNGFIKLGIIGVAVILVLGGGLFGWKVFLKGGTEGDERVTGASTGHAEKNKDKPGYIIPLDSFVVNLADTNETRYLKITINFEVNTADALEDVNLKIPQIRDAMLMLLTSKTSNDVKDIGGKLKLQDDMAARANKFLGSGKVKAVYFTEFVMQ